MQKNSELIMYEAYSFYDRLRGLLGRQPLNGFEALLISPCTHVHSFGMKYSLDIVFLDLYGVVMKTVKLHPNSWCTCNGAKSVIELKAGYAEQYGFVPGKRIRTMRSASITAR